MIVFHGVFSLSRNADGQPLDMLAELEGEAAVMEN